MSYGFTENVQFVKKKKSFAMVHQINPTPVYEGEMFDIHHVLIMVNILY